MKLLVCGSRDYPDNRYIARCIHYLHATYGITAMCHGGARGADTIAGEVAAKLGIPCRVFPADWKNNGKAAGPIRNIEMLEVFEPDMVLAFPIGESRGTYHMIDIAKKAGVKVIVRKG